LAAVHFETVLAFCLFTAGIYAGARRPDWGLALIAASVPIQRTLLVGAGDTAVTITKVVLWSTVAGWLWATIAHRRRLAIDLISAGLALVTAGIALSGWNAEDGGLWIGETYRWLASVPVAVMAFNVYRAGWSPLPFFIAAACGAIFSYVLAAWQVLSGIGPDSFESRGIMRASGPFGHPNQLAIYFELTAPLLAGITIASWRSRPSTSIERALVRLLPLWLVGSAAGIAGLLLSQSRGGAVGMVAALATLAVIGWPVISSRSHVLMATVAGMVMLGTVGLMLALSTGAFDADQREVQVTAANFAVEERIAHWIAGVEMASDAPLLGVGAGNYDRNFRDFTTTWRFRVGRGHAHNSFIQMLAQGGIVTLAAYLLCIALVATTLGRALDRSPTILGKAVTVGVAGMSAGMLAHAVFEFVHVLSLNLHMAIAWGLLAAVASGAIRGGRPAGSTWDVLT
jgi:O-antigen ligase